MTERRVARAAGSHLPPVVPERLRRCVVEDWVHPCERPPSWWSNDGTWSVMQARSEASVWKEWCLIDAYTKWADERIAWAQRNGIEWRDFVRAFPTGGRPEWRDFEAFAKEAGY